MEFKQFSQGPTGQPQMNEYEAFVKSRLDAGENPALISDQIKAALHAVATDWALWGDDMWRLDTVCSVCGSDYPGLCKHPNEAILRRQYEAKRTTTYDCRWTAMDVDARTAVEKGE